MPRRLSIRLALLIPCLMLLSTTVLAQEATQAPAAPPAETPVRFIELVGPAAESSAEISSLAWYGDYLVLLTENSFLYNQIEDSSGGVFALEKGDILEYLDAENPEPLEPLAVPIFGPDIEDAVNGFEVTFDGFEAIKFVDDPSVFADDKVFLTIEAETVDENDPSMRAYVVWGTVEPDLAGIHLRLEDRIALPRQTDFGNMSYESLLVADNRLIALYEINGAGVNAAPLAYAIDLQSGEVTTIPLQNIEYRITDATDPDASGVFWMPNYFFEGEDFLATDNDPIFAQFGEGASQAAFAGVERLIALQYTGDQIVLVNQPPIQLQMTEESQGRNWEGIARLDDRGFLIVTDRFPQTLLGFVPAGG